MTPEAARAWQHPWLRIERLIRTFLGTRWDNAAWPSAKVTLKDALAGVVRLSAGRHRP